MIQAPIFLPIEFTAGLKSALISRLVRQPEIVFAILYGSAAEGRSFRDLDVAVFVDRAHVPPQSDLDYALTLMDDLAEVVPFPIDVRVVNNAPLAFQYNVSRGEVLLVRDEEALARFRETAWDRYFDFQPVAMQYLKDMR